MEISLNNITFQYLRDKAIKMEKNGKYPLSIGLYSILAELNKNDDIRVAIFFYNQCIRIANIIKDTKILADTYHTLAQLYCKTKEYKTMMEYYNNAIIFYKKLQNHNMESYCNQQIAETYLTKQKPTKAIKYYLKAINDNIKISNQIKIKRNIVIIYINVNKFQDAINLLFEIIQTLNKNNKNSQKYYYMIAILSHIINKLDDLITTKLTDIQAFNKMIEAYEQKNITDFCVHLINNDTITEHIAQKCIEIMSDET